MASPPPPRPWLTRREIVQVARDSIQNYTLHRTNRMAAALAYYTLFSLFPLLLLLLAIIGFLLNAGWPAARDASQYVMDLVAELLPEVGGLVSSALASIQNGRGTSSVIGVLGLLWSASSTFNQLHLALDQIWGLNGIGSIGLTVRRRAISIAVVLGLGLLLVLSQVARSTWYWLSGLTHEVPGMALAQAMFTWLLPFVVSTVVFGLMFRSFPSVPISWRDVWPGAVLAGVGWESLKLLFGLYAGQFANWQAVYGPVAGVIGLLTWLYLSFVVILFGAEFAAAYSTLLRSTPVLSAEMMPVPAMVAPNLAVAQPEPARLANLKPSSNKRRNVPSMAAGTAAGVLGGVTALGLVVGWLLGWRPGRPSSH
jgi:membrane protein